MIKFTVMYPYAPGKRFDFDYYVNKHLAPTRKNPLCRGIIVESGKCEIKKDSEPTYACVAHIFYDLEEQWRNAFEPRQHMLMDDLPNFTDIEPRFQVSQVEFMNFDMVKVPDTIS